MIQVGRVGRGKGGGIPIVQFFVCGGGGGGGLHDASRRYACSMQVGSIHVRRHAGCVYAGVHAWWVWLLCAAATQHGRFNFWIQNLIQIQDSTACVCVWGGGGAVCTGPGWAGWWVGIRLSSLTPELVHEP